MQLQLKVGHAQVKVQGQRFRPLVAENEAKGNAVGPHAVLADVDAHKVLIDKEHVHTRPLRQQPVAVQDVNKGLAHAVDDAVVGRARVGHGAYERIYDARS